MSLPITVSQPPEREGAAANNAGSIPASHHHGEDDAAAEAYERAHVHGVYEAIAPHFSATRYKPWPVVAAFLHAQQAGAVGLDVGCGNGKYLGVNRDVFAIGSDRSAALVGLARQRLLLPRQGQQGQQEQRKGKGQSSGEERDDEGDEAPGEEGERHPATDVLVADGLCLPFRDRAADFAVCVAVIHHLSTRERRREAIRELLRCVRGGSGPGRDDGGRVLVYVWALEQGGSRRGWDEGGQQDLLVPWVMKTQQPRKRKQKEQQKKKEKEPSPQQEQAKDREEERDDEQGIPRREAVIENRPLPADGDGGQKTFQRYYHLYKKGELEEDVVAAQGHVLESGYDRDNWWVVATEAS